MLAPASESVQSWSKVSSCYILVHMYAYVFYIHVAPEQPRSSRATQYTYVHSHMYTITYNVLLNARIGTTLRRRRTNDNKSRRILGVEPRLNIFQQAHIHHSHRSILERLGQQSAVYYMYMYVWYILWRLFADQDWKDSVRMLHVWHWQYNTCIPRENIRTVYMYTCMCMEASTQVGLGLSHLRLNTTQADRIEDLYNPNPNLKTHHSIRKYMY